MLEYINLLFFRHILQTIIIVVNSYYYYCTLVSYDNYNDGKSTSLILSFLVTVTDTSKSDVNSGNQSDKQG